MKKITIIGLGYVGLPLAIEFARKFDVTGFDISKYRVNELKKGIDTNGEFTSSKILKAKLNFTYSESDLNDSDFYIITVPTPLKKSNKPDLRPLKSASQIVGKKIKRGEQHGSCGTCDRRGTWNRQIDCRAIRGGRL